MLARQLHQGQVSLMQVSHGRHECDAQLAAQLVSQFFDGVNDFQKDLRAE
jgi:hypothetical protein